MLGGKNMMNDYIDYYSYMNNLNQMNGNAVSNKVNNQSNNVVKVAEPYVGFTRGNMFDSLYYGYKNYKPQELNPQDDKEYMCLLMQMYLFAAHDLGLYLDVNPNDTDAIKKRTEYMNMYNEALTQYENNYGPVTQNSMMLSTTPWAWDTKKWPWEGNR